MGNFITNSGKVSMKERIEILVSNSKKMKFLVGFFYFSGISELYRSLFQISDKLQEEHIQILVGLSIDRGIHGIYEISKKQDSTHRLSIDKIKEDLFNSLRIAFTHKDMDRKDLYDQIDFFVNLLKERKIVIRKTKNPNHAKLYLFKMDDSISKVIPNLFITGSSNLTRAGLESQDEFNVEVKDYGFSEAEEYFDRLWRDSVEIGPEDVNKIVKVIENETFFRKISPFEAYAYVLKSYVDSFESIELGRDIIYLLERKGYKVYDYQLDAVKQAVVNCHLHNGVLIADVVGLGKTVVACMVAKLLGKRGMVICPPHLMGDENKTSGWRKYLSDFEIWDWEVRSLGKLPEALEFVKNNPDIGIIIVDEAHRFRNEDTESYHYLREICRGKVVILLSATPFNNRPSDIFSLIKLFTIPKKSSIVFDENLKAKFDYYQDLFKKLSYIKNYYNSKEKSKNI
ncbi:MAG: phospholipase D-like domain-containing protein, partial [Candidatus Calescibacterium sp.]|nr:phospholipase D-like domain-containing protein [Candidatus Calescibacterium sp.]MDW8132676.1 phospholipase D-like domain-containing protein [Candidatus Calescibacterium sp.]